MRWSTGCARAAPSDEQELECHERTDAPEWPLR
jgi:hypothetical protein